MQSDNSAHGPEVMRPIHELHDMDSHSRNERLYQRLVAEGHFVSPLYDGDAARGKLAAMVVAAVDVRRKLTETEVEMLASLRANA
jgi:hypothetical protein